ncbi:hypothetical protein SAMN04488505_10734 [Chitinophaga rupis]|uniref:Right handed beta helix region n=2 Tax=Chitinophaga rupis TaxID=573321 RepID=A0A1H8CAL0_9BACT|nr:hypothetical protein SAMN04488505_10734 [Chitinophaga rupis]
MILCLFPLLSHATKYYVSSSSGSDSYTTSSAATPWRTLKKISDSTVLNAGDTIFLKSGDVFNEPLNLKRSGNSSSHIVYTTYGGAARTVINGFYTLSNGTPISSGSNIYRFYCPGLTVKTNMLVMDGIPQPMGRWPDVGYLTYDSLQPRTLYAANLSSSPYNWTGAVLVAHSEFYLIDTGRIVSQASGTITIDTTFTSTSKRGSGYFIENDARTLLLTAIPGRWYNKYTVDSIQVYLPGGQGTHVLKVPILDVLCNANFGTKYNDIYNMDFEGSNIASVLINNTTGHTFTNCLFRYGGNDCLLGNECPGTNFINDTLDYFQNNGARITGNTSQHCLTKNVLINHCGTIPGMGQREPDGSKSYSGWANPMGFNTFQNMTILNSGYTGLHFGGDSVNITNVVVDTFCITKIDGGGFYTWDGAVKNYNYGRTLTNCMALHGQRSSAGVKYDSTDASMGFYFDSHSTFVTLTGCTSAYNTTGGIYIHGSGITTRGNNFYGNGWCQRCVVEYPGIPITGLSLKKDQLTNSAPGQLTSVFITPGTDLYSFGTVDSNYYSNTSAAAFYTKSSTDPGTTRTFASWQTVSGYDAHSSFLNTASGLYYNKTGTAAASVVHFSDLAGNSYNGVITVPAFSSLILYQKIP